jgi:uncharacterized protein (TIGR02118 family)
MKEEHVFVISVLYPLTPGTTFNMDYYVNSHVPLVKRLFEPMGQRDARVFKGVSDGGEGAPTFGVIAELYFDDMESLTAALVAHGAETQADIPNFTGSIPVIQISEMLAV